MDIGVLVMSTVGAVSPLRVALVTEDMWNEDGPMACAGCTCLSGFWAQVTAGEHGSGAFYPV